MKKKLTETEQQNLQEILDYEKNIKEYDYNPIQEEIVEVLLTINESGSNEFCRLQANNFLSYFGSNINTKVQLPNHVPMTCNFYGIGLGTSGIGKTSLASILKNCLLKDYLTEWRHLCYQIEEQSLNEEVSKRFEMIDDVKESKVDDILEEIKVKVKQDYYSLGAIPFIIKEGTEAAIRQVRTKRAMSKIGALNVITDEIANTIKDIQANTKTFLEAYDEGKVEETIRKVTKESMRYEIDPDFALNINILMYGSPEALLNGDSEEEAFKTLLQTGYARRCFFCYVAPKSILDLQLSVDEYFQKNNNKDSLKILESLSKKLAYIASPENYNQTYKLSPQAYKEYLTYERLCKYREECLRPLKSPILSLEALHRHIKMVKLACTYAVLDNKGTYEIELEHIKQAIKFSEESGEAIKRIMRQPKGYERIANYIIDSYKINKEPIREIDLTQFPFFEKASQSKKDEYIRYALSYSYSQDSYIQRGVNDLGETVFTADAFEETDLDKLDLSFTLNENRTDDYFNYSNLSLDSFVKNGLKTDGFFCVHQLQGEENGLLHRSDSNTLAGFNLLVLDIDSNTSLEFAKQVLKDYVYVIYTTKSHKTEHRDYSDCFRIILPLKYKLFFNTKDYKDFMKNIYSDLPLNCDEVTLDRCRAWATNPNGEIYTNLPSENEDLQLFNPIKYIPRTVQNEKREIEYKAGKYSSKLEKYFIDQILTNSQGQRNILLLKYGLALKDMGIRLAETINKIKALNKRLENSLEESELQRTIFTTLRKRYDEHEYEPNY